MGHDTCRSRYNTYIQQKTPTARYSEYSQRTHCEIGGYFPRLYTDISQRSSRQRSYRRSRRVDERM